MAQYVAKTYNQYEINETREKLLSVGFDVVLYMR
jgi:hypothetical protein